VAYLIKELQKQWGFKARIQKRRKEKPAATMTTAASAVRHRAWACESRNSKTNYRYNKLFAVHKN
jgi:hypothetical protein